MKLKEVKSLIQKAFWVNFGNGEVSTVLQAAEAECERVVAVPPNGNHEAYDFMLNHLQGLIKTAKEVHGLQRMCVADGNDGSHKVIRKTFRVT